ncbi:unnamed protein product [Mycena citricolor]|uniref:HMG box domain-containing protein n=1 Tax=Mycena citricolor TaxID=2018698 RepID=A0AAD2HVX1_9AGAR|nr:unnamed protein product [Mycena citricolor]
MPALRSASRRTSGGYGRRRSSIAPLVAKPGTYGYAAPTAPSTILPDAASASSSSLTPSNQATVTFAPNVTPITYNAPSPDDSSCDDLPRPGDTDVTAPLFPPSNQPAPAPRRKRVAPGKRRSLGYIPRPPNAFMLFRANFVRSRHIPGSLEATHSSLSKIIGTVWRSLSLREKATWEKKAKDAKAEHKIMYPDYKFRPVHGKARAPIGSYSNSDYNAARTIKHEMEEKRSEDIASLLLQGKKGDELTDAVNELDVRRRAEYALSKSETATDRAFTDSPSPGPELLYNPNIPDGYGTDVPMSMPKYPHPLNLDPGAFYLSRDVSSPPSSTLTAGSPYQMPLPMPLYQQQQQLDSSDRWRHRRSSSVPLPTECHYGPFYGHDEATMSVNSNALTLPPIHFPIDHTNVGSWMLPPPPTAAEDSLSGAAIGISAGSQRMSLSWGSMGSTGYMRPSFSFGFRNSYSSTWYAAGGTGYAANTFDPIGRRASSAQAFFSPTSFKFNTCGSDAAEYEQQLPEELPDADTSLFHPGFLNTFGGAPVSELAMANFEVQQASVLHAPQPMNPVSPLNSVEFHPPAPQYSEPPAPEVYDVQDPVVMESSTPTPVAQTSSLSPQLQYPESAAPTPAPEPVHYPPFEFASDSGELHFAARPSIDIGMLIAKPVDMAYAASYANEFE